MAQKYSRVDLHDGYQTFMDMAWISVGYGSDIEGAGDSLMRTVNVTKTA